MNYNISEKDRVVIGKGFTKISFWRLIVGVPLIYIPAIITVPFVFIGVFLVRAHLRLLGARNLKTYKDFLPARKSYRYSLKNQITAKGKFGLGLWLRSKLYWFYNCGIYCPYSVALFEYMSYLVKIVENWWCPFDHDKKSNYANAPIDKSYWHLSKEGRAKLHKDDLECSIWNDEKG